MNERLLQYNDENGENDRIWVKLYYDLNSGLTKLTRHEFGVGDRANLEQWASPRARRTFIRTAAVAR